MNVPGKFTSSNPEVRADSANKAGNDPKDPERILSGFFVVNGGSFQEKWVIVSLR